MRTSRSLRNAGLRPRRDHDAGADRARARAGLCSAQGDPSASIVRRAGHGGRVVDLEGLKPGDTLDRHFHHGIEAGIVLDGGMIQLPGGEPMPMPTGAPIMNLRDIVHGG
ncbi:MAG: hypothetical protein U0527_06595 [Candidatus Eisenbacteria bacterium]